MANAVAAGLLGHEYQALIFWLQACNLMRPNTAVSRVAYEFNEPKSFDDVVVWYDPPIPSGGPDRIHTRYIQSKFKVSYGQTFGHADLIDPAFINAESVSLLQRLRDAQRKVSANGTGVRFTVWSLARLDTADPLNRFVSGVDKSFLIDALLNGTGDRSALGKEIRKPWREHLELTTDEELRPILYPLEIKHTAQSVAELRELLSDRAELIGLVPVDKAFSDCRYCSLIHSLNNRKLNEFDCNSFKEMCHQEKLIRQPPIRDNGRMRVSIRSFMDPGIDPSFGADRLLLLTRHYNARYVAVDDGWRATIQPEVTTFLTDVAAEVTTTGSGIELTLDAHVSLAFLSGNVLHPKLGVPVDFFQKTSGLGKHRWVFDGEVPSGAPDLEFTEEVVGDGAGPDIAFGIGIPRNLLDDVRKHVIEKLPSVSRIVIGLPVGGPSQTAVKNGAHASRLADVATDRITAARMKAGWTGDMHLFLAVPNALAFMLGQRSRGFGPTVLYEFDFDQRANGYTPSITINRGAS